MEQARGQEEQEWISGLSFVGKKTFESRIVNAGATWALVSLLPLSAPTSTHSYYMTTSAVYPTNSPFVFTHYIFNLHSVNQNQALHTKKNRTALFASQILEERVFFQDFCVNICNDFQGQM